MKKIYSTILFFAFMIGAMQPVIPVIEYHLFKESIIELFCVNREKPEQNCDGVCYLTAQLAEQQKEQSEMNSLNIDFYPIGVDYASYTPFVVPPEPTRLYFQFAEDSISACLRSHSPPPRLS